VKILLNRAAEPYPIPPAQLQTALGQPIFHTFPSDYKAVSSALNSGVPLALSGNTEMAAQFDNFIRRIINTGAEAPEPVAAGRRNALGIQRLASIW
jgi:Flp pilus assembly CpaE family ATPase